MLKILFRLLDSKNGNPNSHSQPDLITYQNKANDTDKVGVRESASALDKSRYVFISLFQISSFIIKYS